MKGKKEGGEKKGKEGRKKERGKREGQKKKRRGKKELALTRDLPLYSQLPMAGYGLEVELHIHTIHVYIANFNFDNLTVAALTALTLPIILTTRIGKVA